MVVAAGWPTIAEELVATQLALAQATPPLWEPPALPAVAGCFACFSRATSGSGQTASPAGRPRRSTVAGNVSLKPRFKGRAGSTFVRGCSHLRNRTSLRTRSDPSDAGRRTDSRRDRARPPTARRTDASSRSVLDMPHDWRHSSQLLAVGDWPTDDRGLSDTLPATVERRGRPSRARRSGPSRWWRGRNTRSSRRRPVGPAAPTAVVWPEPAPNCVATNSSAMVGQPAATTMSLMIVPVGLLRTASGKRGPHRQSGQRHAEQLQR